MIMLQESRSLTTSPLEMPSFLAKNMSSVRRRNVGSKVDRRLVEFVSLDEEVKNTAATVVLLSPFRECLAAKRTVM